MRKRDLFWIVPIFLVGSTIHAEYRVYQYIVRSNTEINKDTQPYIVTSTLDPISYLSYHGGDSLLNVDLMRTWMCKGYTGNHTDHCPSVGAEMLKIEELKSNELTETEQKKDEGN